MANLYWFIEQILTTFMGLARTRTTNLKGSSWQGKHSNKQIHIENISYFHPEFSSIVGETKNTKKKPVENGANWPNNPTVSERGSWSRVRSGQGKKTKKHEKEMIKGVYEVILHIFPFLKKTKHWKLCVGSQV